MTSTMVATGEQSGGQGRDAGLGSPVSRSSRRRSGTSPATSAAPGARAPAGRAGPAGSRPCRTAPRASSTTYRPDLSYLRYERAGGGHRGAPDALPGVVPIVIRLWAMGEETAGAGGHYGRTGRRCGRGGGSSVRHRGPYSGPGVRLAPDDENAVLFAHVVGRRRSRPRQSRPVRHQGSTRFGVCEVKRSQTGRGTGDTDERSAACRWRVRGCHGRYHAQSCGASRDHAQSGASRDRRSATARGERPFRRAPASAQARGVAIETPPTRRAVPKSQAPSAPPPSPRAATALRRRFWATLPARLRLLRTVTLLLTVTLTLGPAVLAATGTWDTVAGRDAPRTTSAADLNLARSNDMDAQAANLLLAGGDGGKGRLGRRRTTRRSGSYGTRAARSGATCAPSPSPPRATPPTSTPSSRSPTTSPSTRS